ncbi:protein unc-93 homolog A [Eupeodes corollae]|uniref:protein unc-93 homolog A n=1 Tax=Eupeodes corollae TaxID=290404 RepID=UPI002492201C|nr:protein unc-93 homolog A [Eupeodes corollae]
MRMGSLPNIHELERIERKLGREREIALIEQRAREQIDFNRDRERESVPLQQNSSFNPYFLTTKNHHRHSLTARNVLRTRSSGGSHNIWDDPMLERLAAYSPMSNRSHRINPITPYQVQAALAASRRRESINSSIGATSIRRLLTLNSRCCRHKIPAHIQSKVWKDFTFLTVGHGLMCAILLPLIGLQSSNSVWHHSEPWVHVGPNIGSILLSISFLISTGMCFFTARLIKKHGFLVLIAASYIGMCIFLLGHLCSSIYTLFPAYVILGITLGPAWVGKIALVVHFASRLSCSQHDCALTAAVDNIDDHKIFCNREQKVRRFARWFQASQDIGIIIGAILASLVLVCSSTNWDCFNFSFIPSADLIPVTQKSVIQMNNTSSSSVASPLSSAAVLTSNNFFYLFDEMYNHNEHGERICGADMCPVWNSLDDDSNETKSLSHFVSEKRVGGVTLILIYLIFSIGAFLLTCFSGKFECTLRRTRVKGVTDTLLFAGPMAYFIGTEQAYMLGDFTRAFVSCSLGISMVAGALIGMGLMQSIVSCTLSLLLRYTKRIVIILAGFFFHACLLLVLSRWKPSSDDSALFYVIAASWGACNGMWETLLLALVTLNHTNHVTEVMGPLQGLRFFGLGVTFAAHGFLCENPKILILVIILVVSVPPYAMLEIRLEAQRKAHIVSL